MSKEMLNIGSLLFADVDQIDLTGPFEVLSRIPNATHRIYGRMTDIVSDVKGLALKADAVLSEAPALDILDIPGGFGEEALIDDEAVLNWIRFHASHAKIVFSVCTGALLLGAAGLLVAVVRRLTGRRFISCRASVHKRSTNALSSMARSSRQGASLRESTVRCASPRSSQATKSHSRFSWKSPMRRNHPSTPARREAPPHVLHAATQTFAVITKRRKATAARIARHLPVATMASVSPPADG